MPKQIIIAGTIDLADPSKRDEAMTIAAPLQQKTRTEEPGCLAYVFAPDPCVAGRLCVYELWEDEASLAAHFQHANYFNMRTALGQIGLAGADNKKYRIDLSEPVYDPTFTPRADFFTEKKPAKKKVVKAKAKAKKPAKKKAAKKK
ncbi:MAG: antibiotic biosynthesis monooxygenase [Deltaproteobacteria bacterium]|nr:antibiotic biosynthesis monooxygenase [Deltaproteobacteria bacterium]